MAPRYGDRQGGYLRIVRTGFQKGDGAEKAFIELLGAEKQLDEKRQKRDEVKAKKRAELEEQLEASKKDDETARKTPPSSLCRFGNSIPDRNGEWAHPLKGCAHSFAANVPASFFCQFVGSDITNSQNALFPFSFRIESSFAGSGIVSPWITFFLRSKASCRCFLAFVALPCSASAHARL